MTAMEALESPNKFFIVGCGRSGTTMLQQALNRHSQIVIPPETGYFIDVLGHSKRGQRQHLQKINADLGTDLSIDGPSIHADETARAFYDRLCRTYLDKLGRRSVHWFGEKSPRHLLVLPRIHRILPRAKVILIFRDGRDVAVSLSRVPWGPSDLYVNFGIWLRFYRWHCWALRQRDLDLLIVKYEALVSTPAVEMGRVMDFLDIPREAQVIEGSGNTEGVPEWELGWKAGALEAINTSRIAAWRRELDPQRLAYLESWGREALTSLGYELSSEEVVPLPVGFHFRRLARLTAWRAGRAVQHVKKELLGR